MELRSIDAMLNAVEIFPKSPALLTFFEFGFTIITSLGWIFWYGLLKKLALVKSSTVVVLFPRDSLISTISFRFPSIVKSPAKPIAWSKLIFFSVKKITN